MRNGFDTSRPIHINEIRQAIEAAGEDPDNFDLDAVFDECYVWQDTQWSPNSWGSSEEREAILWESVARHDTSTQ